MRNITTHHDGHGLAESLFVRAIDEPGPGGANHAYEIITNGVVVAYVQYQQGARDVPGSTPGVIDPCLLAIVRDRLESFQDGPFACVENGRALGHVIAAMQALKERADARAARGVLGKEKS